MKRFLKGVPPRVGPKKFFIRDVQRNREEMKAKKIRFWN